MNSVNREMYQLTPYKCQEVFDWPWMETGLWVTKHASQYQFVNEYYERIDCIVNATCLSTLDSGRTCQFETASSLEQL